ncbi:aspartic peptidase domain-containing protein [Xylaria sp. FL1042]|nr:aspartic peptidase domain-containing protein [Xylaria sp. FL1042]
MLPTSLRYICLVLIAFCILLWIAADYENPGFISLPVRAGVPPAHFHRRLGRRSEDIYSSLSGNSTSGAYYIQLYFGNPPDQKVEVLLATDYNDFWVDPNCTAVPNTSECEDRGFYDPTQSSTSYATGVNGSIMYIDGSWANFSYYTDQVSLSTGRGPTDVRFGVATNSSNNPSGILGLGLGAASENGGERNFIDQLADQQFTNSKAFSLALGDGDADDQGVIIFGGIDTKKFAGTLTSNDIQPPQGDDTYARYNIKMTGLGITSSDGTTSSYANGDWVLSIDAGTTPTFVPDGLIAGIYNDLQATYDKTADDTLAPCAQRANNSHILFTFGSTTIRVSFSELLAFNFNETMCYIGIQPADNDLGFLGLSFLRSAYVVFDQTRNEISMQQYVNCGTNEQVLLSSGADGLVGECTVTPSGNATSSTSTPTATPTATPSPGGSTSGLSTSGKVGVGVGVGAGVLLVLFLLYYFLILPRRRAASSNVLQPPASPDAVYQTPKIQYPPQYSPNNDLSGVISYAYDQRGITPMAEASGTPQFSTNRESAQYWTSPNEQWSPSAGVMVGNAGAVELEAQHSPTGFPPASSPATTGGLEHRA